MKSSRAAYDLLAVYGTLRRRSFSQRLPLAVSRLQFFGCGLIRGRLFWQRTYPALIQEHGIAQVELFQIVDANVWDELDLYEGCDPSNLAASLFIRRQVLLWNPRVWAWAYFLNRQIPRGIRHGEDREKFHHKADFLLRPVPPHYGGQVAPSPPSATSAKDTKVRVFYRR
jgi:gamma-glutamylcyclotransferase (GGCT)/AIG2-like uncharacterized protein YtfP